MKNIIIFIYLRTFSVIIYYAICYFTFIYVIFNFKSDIWFVNYILRVLYIIYYSIFRFIEIIMLHNRGLTTKTL